MSQWAVRLSRSQTSSGVTFKTRRPHSARENGSPLQALKMQSITDHEGFRRTSVSWCLQKTPEPTKPEQESRTTHTCHRTKNETNTRSRPATRSQHNQALAVSTNMAICAQEQHQRPAKYPQGRAAKPTSGTPRASSCSSTLGDTRGTRSALLVHSSHPPTLRCCSTWSP